MQPLQMASNTRPVSGPSPPVRKTEPCGAAGRRWLAADTIGPQHRGRQTTCWRHRKDRNVQNSKEESDGKGRSASQ